MPIQNMPLAPLPHKQTDPINLGSVDPDYEGLYVVYNADVPLTVYEEMLGAMDDGSNLKKITAPQKLIEGIVSAWNFSETVIDDQGTSTLVPLPDPSDGGVSKISQTLSIAIIKAYYEMVNSKTKN